MEWGGDLAGIFLGKAFRFITTKANIPIFRGTSEGFPGSKANQLIGVSPASTDPVVATLMATESNNSGKGIVYLSNTKQFAEVGVTENVLNEMEKEIAANVSPSEFPQYSLSSITAEQATGILKSEFGINIPAKIAKGDISRVIAQTRSLTKKEITTFIEKATKLAKTKK